MRSLTILLVFFCVVMFASLSYAEDFTVNGYTISPTVTKNGDTVSVSGRVEGGARCKKLRLDIFLHDQSTHRAYIIATADDVGAGGGRLFSGRSKVYTSGNRWSVSSIYTRCISN